MGKYQIKEMADLLSGIFSEKKVKKAILFGSMARGTESKKSDLDLLIVVDTDKRFFDRYDDFIDIYDKLPGFSVDMLIYTPEEFKAISHRKFIQTIIKEGKTIYEH